jgi:peptide/nickel transport system substrate-binding protein
MEERKREEVLNSQKDRDIKPFHFVGDFYRQQTLLALLLLAIFTTNLFSSTLNLSISANPSRINPILATDSASGLISDYIFTSLLKYDKDGNIVGDLAKEFKFITPTTLEFTIRDDIFWHDGEKLSVDDIIFTFNAINNPKNLTPLINDFKHIKELKRVSDSKFQAIYKYPYFKALEIWMVGVLPKHILKEEKSLLKSRFNFEPIGTGAYKLESSKNSSSIKLKAFDKFYVHKPNIETVNYEFIPDSGVNFLMLKSGKLDIGSLTPMQVNRQLSSEFLKKYRVIESTSFSYTYIGFNLKNRKFQNQRLRDALSLAINRDEIIDILFFGHAKICNGPFLPHSFAYDKSIKNYEFNPLKAKEILAKLGFSEDNPFEFELITNANNKIRVYAAQIVQQQLKEVGVNMKIRVLEWQAFLNTVVHPRKFESVMLGWGLSLVPDAYSIWHSDSDKMGGFNFIGYKNEEVDELIESGNREVNREKLSKIYQRIYKIIHNEKPYLFLYIPNSIQAVSKKLKNIEPTFLGIKHNQIDWIKD